MQNGRIRLGVAAGVLTALTACHHGGSSGPTPTPTASLAFSVQPGAVTAGALFAPAVEVAVLDQNGDLVTVATSVSLSLAGGDGLQGTLSAVTVDGHATFADLSVRKAGAGYTLTASSDGLQPATSAAFDVRAAAPDAAGSDFVATPTTVAVGGQVALAVTLRDAFGNLVPDAEVGFEATGTANTFVQPVGSTDVAGAASGTLTSTKAEAKTLTARSGAVTLSAHPVVIFTAGAADPAGSTLAASPPSVPSDGTAITLTVTVGDRYGNPLAGQAVTFEASGAASIAQPASATTAAGTATGTVSALVAGTQTISAKVGGTVVAQRDVSFVPQPASASASRVVAAPASVPADGTTAATITVTLVDAAGHVVPGSAVSLDPSATASVTPATATSDASGVAAFAASATAVGSITFTATATIGTTAVVLDQRPSVSYTTPLAGAIVVTGAGGATTLDGLGSTLQLAAAVRPVAAVQTVSWASSSPGVVSVDGNGLATAHGHGQAIITATATDGSGATGTLVLTSVNGKLMFVQQPNSLISGQSATASLDQAGTLTVSASYGKSGNAFKYVSGTGYYGTNSNGFVSLPYTVVGDFTVTATLDLVPPVKVNTASGLGVGITTGFLATDRYAYAFLPTSGNAASARYVSASSNVSGTTPPTAPTISYAIPTTAPITVTFSRTGSTYAIAFAGGSSATFAASAFTDGTTPFGAGAVYPCISFNNVVAKVSSFVVRDGADHVLVDSAAAALETYVPASLLLSGSATLLSGETATVVKAQSATVTATAVAAGGGTAAVTAVAADPAVADVSVANGASSSTLTVTGLKVGYTTVTLTNTGDPNPATNRKTLGVVVEEFPATNAASLAAYPAPGETAAFADGELSLAFDATPVLSTYGSIDIYSRADGSLVDRIFFANEAQTVANVTMTVGSQLVRVSGNKLYLTPHFGKLAYGGQYYVGISTTALTATLGGATFGGLSSRSDVATWSFTVRPAPALGTTIRVDRSEASTADFRTLGGALMYLAAHPINGATAITIDVAASATPYVELVNYRAATPNPDLTVTIRGPAGNSRGDTCVIQYTNGGNWNPQNGRASFYFAGANLVLENLTLRNTAVRSALAQAEALYFDSRGGYTMAANNCTFSSNQDTVNTSGRTWVYNSKIEGNTDFIWGTADVSLFERCDLRVINDSPGQTYSIFVARTGTTGAATVGKGYVLKDSTVSVDAGIKAAYGRDAGTGSFYDQVALVDNTFTGGGSLLDPGLWVTTTKPLSLGNSTYVGWKAFGNTGTTTGASHLDPETIPVDPLAASTIAGGGVEYDTRDHILNRVITVSGGTTPTGYTGATTTWDVSSLANAWGAP